MRINPTALPLLFAGAAIFAVAGCGGSDSSNNSPAPTGSVRVFNTLIPSAGNSGTLTVTANGTSLSGASGVNYGTFFPTVGSTQFTSGTLSPTVSGSGLSSPLTLSNSVNLTNTQGYTLVTTGQMGTVGTTTPQVIAIPNFNSTVTTVPAGSAAVRFINLSPGSTPLTLFNQTGVNAAGSLATGTTDVSYGYNGLNNQYVFVPAGAGNNLSIRNSSTSLTDLGLLTSNLTSYNFQPGQAYTVYVYGQTGNINQPLSATVVQDTSI